MRMGENESVLVRFRRGFLERGFYSKVSLNKRHVHIIGQRFFTQIQAESTRGKAFIYRPKHPTLVSKKESQNLNSRI